MRFKSWDLNRYSGTHTNRQRTQDQDINVDPSDRQACKCLDQTYNSNCDHDPYVTARDFLVIHEMRLKRRLAVRLRSFSKRQLSDQPFFCGRGVKKRKPGPKLNPTYYELVKHVCPALFSAKQTKLHIDPSAYSPPYGSSYELRQNRHC